MCVAGGFPAHVARLAWEAAPLPALNACVTEYKP